MQPPAGDSSVTRRTALVVGGSGRIGGAVARALAAEGFAVAVHCHGALAEARALAADLGPPSLAVTADLREEGAVRALVHRVCDHFGRLDAVVVAAHRSVATPLAETTGSDLRTHYDVNVVGPFVVAQEALAAMAHQPEGGAICLVAAAEECRPRPGDLAAHVSRGALPALAAALAAECAATAPRVHVACVGAAGDGAAADAARAAVAFVTGISRGAAAGAS